MKTNGGGWSHFRATEGINKKERTDFTCTASPKQNRAALQNNGKLPLQPGLPRNGTGRTPLREHTHQGTYMWRCAESGHVWPPSPMSSGTGGAPVTITSHGIKLRRPLSGMLPVP